MLSFINDLSWSTSDCLINQFRFHIAFTFTSDVQQTGPQVHFTKPVQLKWKIHSL